jgi:hypothetical protein
MALTPPLTAADAIDKSHAGTELAELSRELLRCTWMYDRDRYDQVAKHLPDLLCAAGTALSCDSEQVSGEILRIRSGVYQLAGWFLAQVGAHDLAYQAVRNALADGQSSGDAVTTAACVACECWLFIRQGRLLDAKRTAAEAADVVEPRRMKDATGEALSAWGWLLLMAGAAAVRNNQEDEAREFLRFAGTAAAGIASDRTGHERYWLALSPATVVMRQADLEVISGNNREALRLAERLPPKSGGRADSRQRHLLSLAAAHAGVGEKSEATALLTQLRSTAPCWLRHQRAGRATARALLDAQARTFSADVRILADFYDFRG